MGYVDTEIHSDAINICSKFKRLFDCYAKCHQLMNSVDYFDDGKLNTLGKLNNFRMDWYGSI